MLATTNFFYTSIWKLSSFRRQRIFIGKSFNSPIFGIGKRDKIRFNQVQRVVRCSVEQTLGVWHPRWRIIDKQGRPIRAKQRAPLNIIATAVFYNICIKSRTPDPPNIDIQEEDAVGY